MDLLEIFEVVSVASDQSLPLQNAHDGLSLNDLQQLLQSLLHAVRYVAFCHEAPMERVDGVT
jgi:hypothetical protein